MNEKVIVIGGGLAGLTAANFLALAGQQVILFEKSHALGGRAATTQKDGIHFNLGPHALYRGGPGYRIFRELGVEFDGGVPKVNGNFAIRDGRKYTLPGGLLSLMTTNLFGLSAKLETARLLARFDKLDAKSANPLTVREWLEKEVRHVDARRLVQALFRVSTYAHDPDRQSAGVAIRQLQMALAQGVLYLHGGWQTLADGLRAKAVAAGVKIVAETRVAKIGRDALGGHVTGVRLADGAHHAASAVIAAASPAEVCELIEDGEQAAPGEWARTAIPVKAACLDVALSRLPRPQATFALGIDQPLYFSVHSAVAKLAPTGNAVIHAAKYLGSEDAADPKAVERELEAMFDLAQPGWRDLTLARRFLPAMTVSHSLMTAEQGGYSGRPDIEVPGIEGLYVAGDWVGAEGLLADASVASGKRAAEMAVNNAIKRVATVAA